MDNEKPFLSFVVLAEGVCSHLLTHTLDSILAQAKKNFEVILILSPYSERENLVLQSYRDQLSHVYVSLSADLSYMLNRGVHFSRGEYIQFFFPGNYFLTEFATQSIEDFAKEKNIPDLISSQIILRKKDRAPHIGFFDPMQMVRFPSFFPRMVHSHIFRKTLLIDLRGFMYPSSGFEMLLRLYHEKKWNHERLARVLLDQEICPYPVFLLTRKQIAKILQRLFGWKRALKFFLKPLQY